MIERKTFIFRTPDLLAKPFWKRGEPCFDSLMKILAIDKIEAQNKYLEYVRIGRNLGFYRAS